MLNSLFGRYILLNISLIGFVNAVAVYCILGVRDGMPQSHESAYTVFRFPPAITNTITARPMQSIEINIAAGAREEKVWLYGEKTVLTYVSV